MAQPGSSQERDGDGPEDRRSEEATKFHPSQARNSADFNACRPAYVLSGTKDFVLGAPPDFSRMRNVYQCSSPGDSAPVRPCSSRRPVCPLHRVPLVNSGIQVVENSRYLLKKTVLCMNFRLGCPYRMKLRHLKKHCDEQCKFTPVPCELCEEVIAECHFQQHSQQCPRRDPAKDLQH
ncbi:hypothetical protein HPB52_006595 [Rhipicephalus sanguineus]|uniref:TRAF-type domain-containing protein n=1 Tax=Rhipicephalus sanguineus TaxID=34632 RepID=A0A9D4PXF2_RHISA|nr:hypothetical protein HPB52_006595 [Rhipicephalus sanguineus]